jgi:hypothetical protein
MGGQHDLPVSGEEHGIAFPMAGYGSIEGAVVTLGDGPAVFHVKSG